MQCMLMVPRAAAGVVPRLGLRACSASAGIADASMMSPPPPPGPPPPEPFMWDRNSSQHQLHRKRLPPPPPSQQRSLRDTTAFPECTENTTLGFGKYRGRTFRNVLDADVKYCNWVVMEASRNPTRCSAGFIAFVNYLRAQGIQQQHGGPERVADERQPKDSFWSQPRDEPNATNIAQGSHDDTLRDNTSTDLASGQWKVTFGEKHVGSSFAEVLATDAAYCDFMIGQVLHSTMPPADWIDSKVLSFVAYVQHMRLRADPTYTVTW